MSSTRRFRIASHLGLATTLVLFALMTLGSLVRTTGSGLACPDWPLCHGRLIPPFQFDVLVEWFHRLVALLASLLLAATVLWIVLHAELRARLGGLAVLALGLLMAQILLGALTVWKLLDPSVVGGHLATALLLFSTCLTLTLVAQSSADGEPVRGARPPWLLGTVGFATLLTFAQAVLGGMVSTNHAGLACPDWPTCLGEWFPPLRGLVGLQMLHRYGAYALIATMVLAAWHARSAADPAVRNGAALALSLTLGQAVLGVCNVLLGTPPWLSVLHLATATTILAVMVTTTFRVATLRAEAQRWAAAVAQ